VASASGGWTSPAATAMARRGAAVARDGVGARGEQGGLICTRVRVTAGDAGRASPCHGGSSVVRTAGAARGA
jgi:hypothetical protein